MKKNFTGVISLFVIFCMLSIASCKKDHTESNTSNTPGINVQGSNVIVDFGTVVVGQTSVKNVLVSGTGLSAVINITASDAYKVSTDNNNFSTSISIPGVTSGTTIYVQFAPSVTGVKTGTIQFESTGAAAVSLSLTGNGGIQRTYTTFNSEKLAFGTGLSQSAEHQYTLAADLSHVNKINMYVKLRCPSGNCGDWDVYAHIQVKDPASGDWYELGRFITPYGVDNHTLSRGFEIDVTDFKSLLHDNVTLRAFVEVWTNDGWLLSVDFDYLEGTPDYPYSAISKVLQYNENSLAGVIYGEDASAFDLTKTINVPANSEATSLRTIITGWGEATPDDPGGRPCAEWCFRTHHILINGASSFSHYLGPIGCSANPVSGQGGNWTPDRAGWCPGMAVPVRSDQLSTSMAGQSVGFQYSFEPWINNLASPNSNPHAYNAISTYVVVKSNSPISKPVVID